MPFKKSGDENYHAKGNDGVPQTKARQFYESMYKEDPDGSKADYALYYWARALGTEGKISLEIKLLQQHLRQFGNSKMRAKAMYLLGFTYANIKVHQYDKAISVLEQVVREYPDEKESPESLWLIAFLLHYGLKRYQEAIPYLQQLQQNYPESPRSKYVAEEIQQCKNNYP